MSQSSHQSGRRASASTVVPIGKHDTRVGRAADRTVKSYIRSGYRKAGVNSRAQAVLWGVENGLRSGGLRTMGRSRITRPTPDDRAV
jgi:hypothetical protein